jgi:hypothetical protein
MELFSMTRFSFTFYRRMDMKRTLFLLTAGIILLSVSASAATVAYWRFEEGPEWAQISHGGLNDGTFFEGVADSSNSGNGLSVWTENTWAGYSYRSDVALPSIPQTGAVNGFSAKNTGGYPGMFTNPQAPIHTWAPAAFTIEATFKAEAGWWRCVVGRDGDFGVSPAVWLGMTPEGGLRFMFVDQEGREHNVWTEQGLIQGFSFSSDPDGRTGKW